MKCHELTRCLKKINPLAKGINKNLTLIGKDLKGLGRNFWNNNPNPNPNPRLTTNSRVLLINLKSKLIAICLINKFNNQIEYVNSVKNPNYCEY